MKKLCSLLLLLSALLLCISALGEETDARRVYLKGDVPDIPPEEVLLELFVAPTTGCDGMLMVSGDQVMVIDMCTNGQYSLLRDLIRAQGIERIHYAFNTHPDRDHLGGMPQMILDFQVDCMMTAFPENYTNTVTIQVPVVNTVKKAGIPIVTIANGDEMDFGNAHLTVLRQNSYKATSNMLSAMLMVQVGQCRMLLTGDAENLAQKHYAEHGYDLKADIMKYPHHGLTKLEPAFLNAVSPEAVFITHTILNTKAAQKCLRKAGIPFGVSSWGPFHIVTNGQYWIIDHQIPEDKLYLLAKYKPDF